MAFNLRGFVSGHKVLVGVALLIALLTGWWKYEFPSGTWRYKMTVTVETPEGIKTGYAVREVVFTDGPKLLPDVAGANWSVRGEAVAVDLGQGKYLFALMDIDGSYRIVHDAFPYSPASGQNIVRYYKSLTGQKKVLEHNQYPTLVTFTDIKDPKTVTLVYGGQLDETTQQVLPVNDLEKIFGKGVKLKDITLEMTDEDVTWKVANFLSWLNQYYDQRLDGERFGTIESKYRLANSLSAGSFSTGEEKHEQ